MVSDDRCLAEDGSFEQGCTPGLGVQDFGMRALGLCKTGEILLAGAGGTVGRSSFQRQRAAHGACAGTLVRRHMLHTALPGLDLRSDCKTREEEKETERTGVGEGVLFPSELGG